MSPLTSCSIVLIAFSEQSINCGFVSFALCGVLFSISRQSQPSSSGMSPVPVNLPLNSSPYPQDSSLLQPNQLSPQSACVSPRPSSSGAILDGMAGTNGYHRACSPSSLSGGSNSPNSAIGSQKPNGSLGKQQPQGSPPNVSAALASRNNIRVVIPNSHVNMVSTANNNTTSTVLSSQSNGPST